MRFLLLVLGAFLALAPAPAASAKPHLPPAGQVFTGVALGDEVADFSSRSGRRPSVWQHWIQWGGNYDYALQRARSSRTRAVIALSTAPGQNAPGRISPGQIARGDGDRYLVQLNRRLAEYGDVVYLRLLPEMNNCDLAYSSHDCSGRRRGADHAPVRFRQAWKRMVVVLRGGPVATVNSRLRALGQPVLKAAPKSPVPVPAPPGATVADAPAGKPALPRPRIAIMWSPMTGGSPMIAALRPQVFWPGARYVDWVATSFYSRYPNFHYLEPYYRNFAVRYRKPFAFGEWAIWGADDPAFVRRLFGWVRTHRRTRMMIYNQGKDPAGPFRLRSYPGAATALRQAHRSPRYAGS